MKARSHHHQHSAAPGVGLQFFERLIFREPLHILASKILKTFWVKGVRSAVAGDRSQGHTWLSKQYRYVLTFCCVLMFQKNNEN